MAIGYGPQYNNFASLMGSAKGDPDTLQKLMNIFEMAQKGKNLMDATQKGSKGNIAAIQQNLAKFKPPAPENLRPGRRMWFQKERNSALAGI